MTQQAFERMTQELLVATDALLKSELRLPGLVLIYAGIDIMASLNRPQEKEAVTRSDFIQWAEEYLLRVGRLGCEARDLYGARCGLLHTYSAESALSEAEEAKEIWYAWGTGRPEDLQRLIEAQGITAASAIHIDDLMAAFRRGVKLFERSLYDDPERAELVYGRAGKFLATMAAPGGERRAG